MLIPLKQAKAFLQVGNDSENDLIQTLTDGAEDLIARYCGLTIAPNQCGKVTERPIADGTNVLPLNVRPIHQVKSVKIVTNGDMVDPNFYQIVPTGLLASAGNWGQGAGMYEVNYTGGLTHRTLPPGMRTAMLLFLRQVYHDARSDLEQGTLALSGIRIDGEIQRLLVPYKMVIRSFC